MRSSGHSALRCGIQGIPASLLVRFSFLDPASLCGVTRFSTWYPEIPARLLVRFSFLDPASLCGVTRFSMWNPGNTGRSTCKIHSPYGPFLDPASRAGWHPLSYRTPTWYPEISGGESHCCYSSYAMNWTPHHVRGDVPGYAAPRRSIQEIEAREYSLSMRLEYST